MPIAIRAANTSIRGIAPRPVWIAGANPGEVFGEDAEQQQHARRAQAAQKNALVHPFPNDFISRRSLLRRARDAG
ncbi:hypothetical protein ACLMLE_28320 [Lysobacter capsici]